MLAAGLAALAGLNPCFNGRYSQRLQEDVASGQEYRLNPCFNGRYSQRTYTYEVLQTIHYCLNPCFNGRYSQSRGLFQARELHQS